jgi:hypothetical protein
MYANTNVDVPAIPSEIYSLFENKQYRVVLDVGGDDLGAKAVARFKEEIVSDDYEMFFVINTRRIMTDSAEKIICMISEIEESAHIKVTKLINNTNVLEFTTPEIILEGQRIIEQVSQKLGIPIGLTAGLKDIVDKIDSGSLGGSEKLQMKKLIYLPWDKE